MKAIIFAGGIGTRLWPLSRKMTPKQFEKVVGNFSMLQMAVDRLLNKFEPKDIYISTGKIYEDIVRSQLPSIPVENIITEPAMRDVGPAVGLLTAIFSKLYPHEPTALLWGSDHLVKEVELFSKVLHTAGKVIAHEPNKIVFIGQKPRFASQNLGWIESGPVMKTVDDINLYAFKGFKYRPGLSTAQRFFKDGKHSWNLGYFVTTPAFLWDAFEKFAPDMFAKLKIIQNAWGTSRFTKVLDEIYPTIEKISFDNAIIDNLDPKNSYVISENLGWSDIGAWEALKEALEENPEDNVTQGNVYLVDSKDSLIFNSKNDKLIVGIDLDENIIINTHDVILITKKNSVPKIKILIEKLEAQGGYEDIL